LLAKVVKEVGKLTRRNTTCDDPTALAAVVKKVV